MELRSILEALLFCSSKPLSPAELKRVLGTAAEGAEDESVRAAKEVSADEIATALAELADDHEQAGRAYRLACVAGAWQFVNRPEFSPWLKALQGEKVRPSRLSLAALETLAILAYRQPVTRAEIEQIRGVSVDGVMQTLLERGLVEATGRAEVIGRPVTYGTTTLFLEYFGLRSLEELPEADELRRIPVASPTPPGSQPHGDEAAPATVGESEANEPAPSQATQDTESPPDGAEAQPETRDHSPAD